ncbi:hypothetical protein L1049_016807 [Liquidambar formosana]|uniref:Uncharacterized protein n=1 Tax=Liquidambar formosana TaxID=63359 RepID=A0AAP0X0U8_LIQFO
MAAQDVSKNGVLAVQSLRNNIMASSVLASTATTLSSLIALFFSILVCFLGAFLLTVQSIRYYSHASILINVPVKKMSPHPHHHLLTSAEYVARIVNRGSCFWSLGLRSFYLSLPLFLWIFGPIPMFLCCIALVFMLYFLDVTCGFGWFIGPSDDDHHQDEELGSS